MSIVLPRELRQSLQERLWENADALNWIKLSDAERADWYQRWTSDPELGGVLGHFMDPRKVRVYIKDSLLKPYFGARPRYSAAAILAQIGEPNGHKAEEYTKPLGLRLVDGRTICWGNSRDWKLILMACFERAVRLSCEPHAALLQESGRTVDAAQRALVETAALRLGIKRVVWLD
jgi:hypothetical protein